VRSITGHRSTVFSVAFDSTHLLASGSHDKNVKIWNKHTGDLLRTLKEHMDGVVSVAFASNNVLASSSYDTTIILWDTNTGESLRTLQGHETIWQVAFDASNLLASCSWDRAVILWSKWYINIFSWAFYQLNNTLFEFSKHLFVSKKSI